MLRGTKSKTIGFNNICLKSMDLILVNLTQPLKFIKGATDEFWKKALIYAVLIIIVTYYSSTRRNIATYKSGMIKVESMRKNLYFKNFIIQYL